MKSSEFPTLLVDQEIFFFIEFYHEKVCLIGIEALLSNQFAQKSLTMENSKLLKTKVLRVRDKTVNCRFSLNYKIQNFVGMVKCVILRIKLKRIPERKMYSCDHLS